MKLHRIRVEALEPRIAPASVTVSYVDVDGDLVKIKASNALPDAPPLDLGDLAFVGDGASGQLALLNLTEAGFDGASVAFTVVKKAGGDGFADVGRIEATGVKLGGVTVKGDLGVIDAGSGTGEALKSLTARSMGLHGLASQGGAGDLQSDISGSVGSLTIISDLQDAFVRIFGGESANLGKLNIRGSLIGGTAESSGLISTTGGMGTVMIGGDVVGGSGIYAGGIAVVGTIDRITVRGSMIGGPATFFRVIDGIFHEGQIFATGDIGPIKVGRDLIGQEGFAGAQIRSDASIVSITIGGAVIGGAGLASGHLAIEGSMGPVKIGGDLIGGPNAFTGMIEAFATLGNVTVGGSIIGGPSSVSGLIQSGGDMGVVKIAGDLIGGSISGTETSLDSTGSIGSGGRIASITIGRSVFAGTDTSSNGSLTSSGSIRATNDIGSLTVKGSLIGSFTELGLNRVLISARGQAAPSAAGDIAFGKITIGGRVERTDILAGYNGVFAMNGNAQIGAVTVGGDWRASSLVAGIQDAGAPGFGDAGDIVIPNPAPDAIVSRIGKVTIKGIITGSGATGDQFGITAQQIGVFKVGKNKLSLTEATDTAIALAPITADVNLREV
jgi:hypothetical protein